MGEDRQSQQVEQNHKVFKEKLPELLKSHKDKFVLMKDGEIIDYYDTFEKADLAGLDKYKDDIFSVQEVTDIAIDLGIYSNVLCFR